MSLKLMRERFAGFFERSPDDLTALWATCEFSFDANALLNLYKYTPELRERFLEVLAAYRERLWLPYYAAEEYFSNRVDVIKDQLAAYRQLDGYFEKFPNDIGKSVRSLSPHPHIDAEKVRGMAQQFATEMRRYLKQQQSHHENLFKDDHIRARLLELFADKVGDAYRETERLANLERADWRYKAKIPPGYEDASKRWGHPFGDALIWFQLLDRGKQTQRPIVFVTDDAKEDWWEIVNDAPSSPRPELIQEMKQEASIDFYMFNSSKFVTRATDALGLAQNPAIIKEAQDVAQEANAVPASVEAALTWEQLYGNMPRPPNMPFRDYVASRLTSRDIAAYVNAMEPRARQAMLLPLIEAATHIGPSIGGAAGNYPGNWGGAPANDEGPGSEGVEDDSEQPNSS